MNLQLFARKNVDSAILNNQVIIEDFDIGIGKSVSKRCFRNGVKIDASCELKGKDLFILNEGKEIGPLKKGLAFRLAPSRHIDLKGTVILDQGRSERIKFYLNNYGKLAGSYRMGRIFLYDMKSKVKHKRFKKIADLKHSEGITFIVDKILKTKVKLICWDTGGIYDYHIDTEPNPLPPQVPGSHYATEYFAHNCAWLWKRTKKRGYKNAAELALQWSLLNYRYPFSNICFDSTDFKFGPILLAYQLLRQTPPVEYKYEETGYDPVNIFAIRALNYAILGEENKVLKNVRKVEKNQTSDGLIQDNYKPHYKNAKDITYHQYSIAYLSETIDFIKDPKLKTRIQKIVAKGIKFSENLIFRNGEVSYYGRGNNNIYHIGAAILAFSKAGKQSMVEKMASYLCKKPGWMPSALNDFPEFRMGWNHCEMPYNMQTSFFLLRSSKAKARPTKLNYPIYLKDSGFFHFRNQKYEACITNGGEQLTWSNGRHATGVAGIANLTLKDEPVSLCLDQLDNKTPITDMPRIKVKGKYLHPKEFKMERIENGVSLSASYKGIRITKHYKFLKDRIRFSVSVRLSKGLTEVEVDGLCNLPTVKDTKARIRILTSDGVKKIKMDWNVSANAKGRGVMKSWGFSDIPEVLQERVLRAKGEILF